MVRRISTLMARGAHDGERRGVAILWHAAGRMEPVRRTPGGGGRGPSLRLGAAVAVGVFGAAGCASTSRMRPVAPAVLGDRDALLRDAHDRARSGDRDDARAELGWLLERNPDDDEARAALARLDAWDGRRDAAETADRAVLGRHPDDDETRAALVDLLLWRGDWTAAEGELAEGLRRRPGSSALLSRRARVDHWRGREIDATRAADAAEEASPEDPEVQTLRDRLFRGEARLIGRLDVFPSGYNNLPTAELWLTQNWHRWTFTARTLQASRPVTGGPSSQVTTAYSALYALGASLTLGRGTHLGLEVGVGAPSTAITQSAYTGPPTTVPQSAAGAGSAATVPAVSVRPTLSVPITPWLAAELSYSFWYYSSGETVQIWNPVVTWQIDERFRLEGRAWVSYVVSVPPAGLGLYTIADVAVSAGIRGGFHPMPRVDLALEYIRARQLDVSPGIYQLVSLSSNIAVASVDWLIDRRLGVRPLYRFESRTGSVNQSITIPVHTFEIGVYTRW